ncbi:uncharacterized protein [Montipora foliosa]
MGKDTTQNSTMRDSVITTPISFRLVVMSLELDKVYTIFLNNQHCLILHMEPRMYKMSGCAGVFSLIGHATNYVVTDVLSNFA